MGETDGGNLEVIGANDVALAFKQMAELRVMPCCLVIKG
jgi:hypothetical protein